MNSIDYSRSNIYGKDAINNQPKWSKLSSSLGISFSSTEKHLPELLPSQSSIECGTIDSHIPQTFCDTQNIALHLDEIPKISANNNDMPNYKSLLGPLSAKCELDENWWFTPKRIGTGAARWFQCRWYLNYEAYVLIKNCKGV